MNLPKKFKFLKNYKELKKVVSRTDITYSPTDLSELLSSFDYFIQLFNRNRGYKPFNRKKLKVVSKKQKYLKKMYKKPFDNTMKKFS